MKVKLMVSLSGSRNGEPWPQRGEVMELPDAEAVDMINARIAEAVPEVEKAVMPAKKVQKATRKRA